MLFVRTDGAAAGTGGANVFPFGTAATSFPGLHIQCVYDSSHFTSAPVPVTTPVIINSIEWRANDVATTTSWVGGTYTTAIMLAADRYPPAFAATATGPVLALGATWLALRDTPTVVHPRRAGPRFVAEVVENREAMKLVGGYTFHSWELLGMWAWTPTFVAASLAVSGLSSLRAVELGSYLSASFHVMGLLSSWSMGALSDRLGRRRVLVAVAATSTVCSFVFGCLILLALLMVSFSKGLTFFKPTYTLRLITKNVGGLKEQATVLMAGVQVGHVTGARLSRGGVGEGVLDVELDARQDLDDRVVAEVDVDALAVPEVHPVGVHMTPVGAHGHVRRGRGHARPEHGGGVGRGLRLPHRR